MRQWSNLELVWGQSAENREPDWTLVWATSISPHSPGCGVTSGGTHHSHGLLSTSSMDSHKVTTQSQASSIDLWDNCSEDFQCSASASGIFCLSGLGKALTLLELQSSPEGSLWTGMAWVIRGRTGRASCSGLSAKGGFIVITKVKVLLVPFKVICGNSMPSTS